MPVTLAWGSMYSEHESLGLADHQPSQMSKHPVQVILRGMRWRILGEITQYLLWLLNICACMYMQTHTHTHTSK